MIQGSYSIILLNSIILFNNNYNYLYTSNF